MRRGTRARARRLGASRAARGRAARAGAAAAARGGTPPAVAGSGGRARRGSRSRLGGSSRVAGEDFVESAQHVALISVGNSQEERQDHQARFDELGGSAELRRDAESFAIERITINQRVVDGRAEVLRPAAPARRARSSGARVPPRSASLSGIKFSAGVSHYAGHRLGASRLGGLSTAMRPSPRAALPFGVRGYRGKWQERRQ